MQVHLTPGAEADLADARDWYDAQAPGLGMRFMVEFRVLVVRLAGNPNQFPTVRGLTRRAYFSAPEATWWRCLPVSTVAAIHATGSGGHKPGTSTRPRRATPAATSPPFGGHCRAVSVIRNYAIIMLDFPPFRTKMTALSPRATL